MFMSHRPGTWTRRPRVRTNDLEVPIKHVALIAAAVAALICLPSSQAARYPGHVPKRWHAPSWWLPQAVCIHRHEGAWNANTGNGYFGGGQFLRSTWRSVNGPYDPAFDHPGDRRYPFRISPREQLYRMWLVWLRDGRSFREWGTAGYC